MHIDDKDPELEALEAESRPAPPVVIASAEVGALQRTVREKVRGKKGKPADVAKETKKMERARAKALRKAGFVVSTKESTGNMLVLSKDGFKIRVRHSLQAEAGKRIDIVEVYRDQRAVLMCAHGKVNLPHKFPPARTDPNYDEILKAWALNDKLHEVLDPPSAVSQKQ